MADNKNKEQDTPKNIKKSIASIKNLNSLSSMMLGGLNNDGSYDRSNNLNSLSKTITDIITNDNAQLTRTNGKDTSKFLSQMLNQKEAIDKNGKVVDDIADLFDTNAEELYATFQDIYKSKNNMYDDLLAITSRVYDLQEAINVTRDSIASADNLTADISREIAFSTSSDQTDETSYLKTIEAMEDKFKLTKKIKNHIIPKTLLYGEYYVYTVPYSVIFKNFENYKNREGITNHVKESTIVLESSISDIELKKFRDDNGYKGIIKDTVIKESFSSVLENVTVINDEQILLESVDYDSVSALLKFKTGESPIKNLIRQSRSSKKNADGATDGVLDSKGHNEYSFADDCYFELIDPRKMIPVKIMNETIGYYYVRNEPSARPMSGIFGDRVRAMKKMTENSDVERTFLTKIVDKIVTSFDKPFLEKNIKFKELILNAIMYDDNYRKRINFQFIPVDYITRFSINEDENGEGQSMLTPSLFYAKLYLSLLMFNMVTITGKSGDQRLYYVRDSGADTNVVNKVQEIARAMKRNSMNFNDLMSYTTMLNRVGSAKSVFIPIGASGEKSLDFDTLQGQDVQLHSELMDELKRSAINSTGVPAVITNYINEADYAKTLVMANAKFLGRVVSYQQDFNSSLTELYQKMALFSTGLDETVIANMKFKLTLPAGLNTMNYADLINNVDQLAAFIIKVATGENSNQSDMDNMVKDILYRKIVEKYMPFDWESVDSMYEDSKVEAVGYKNEKKNNEDE